MKKIPALFSFFLFIFIFLFFTKPAYAGQYLSCGSPYGGSYTTQDSITFNTSATGLSAIPAPGTITLDYYAGGTFIGSHSWDVAPPVPNSASDSLTTTLSQGNYNGWSAYINYTSYDNVYSVSDSCSTGGTISVTLPPPNLNANISFSGADPTGGAARSNPITFSLTITDNEPTQGIRTVDFYVVNTLVTSLSYTRADLVSNQITGSYTYSSPTGLQYWHVIVSMDGSSKQSGDYYYTAVGAPTPTPPPTLQAPEFLNTTCVTTGLVDMSGIEWCNGLGIQTITATVSTFNAQPPTFNVSGIGSYSQSCTVTGPNTADCTAWPSSIPASGVYTITVSSTVAGITSPTSSRQFGIDSINPSSNPSTPYLTQEGGNWVIRWDSYGADGQSGIARIWFSFYDVSAGCSQSNFGLGPPPTNTKIFQGCSAGETVPLAGHSYQYSVQSCDYAMNCGAVMTGSYDGIITPTYTISGLVFDDLNGNGRQDGSETGYDNHMGAATISLITGGGSPMGTTYTDSFGNFSFSNLTAGNYTVQLAVVPPTYTATTPVNVSLNLTSDGWATFGIHTSSPPPTPTLPPPSSPIINSFRVFNNANPLPAYSGGPAFSGTYGVSGKTDGDQGLNWLNAMRIRIGAQLGATAPFGTYFTDMYVAFYEKDLYQSVPLPTSMDAIITKLNQSANRGKGFVLRTTLLGSYLKDNASTTWIPLSTTSLSCLPVYSPACSGSPVLFAAYKPYPSANLYPWLGAVYTQWIASIGKSTGSKNYYTAVQVKDSQAIVPATFINNYTNITQ